MRDSGPSLKSISHLAAKSNEWTRNVERAVWAEIALPLPGKQVVGMPASTLINVTRGSEGRSAQNVRKGCTANARLPRALVVRGGEAHPASHLTYGVAPAVARRLEAGARLIESDWGDVERSRFIRTSCFIPKKV
jgi:hypothetical protein